MCGGPASRVDGIAVFHVGKRLTLAVPVAVASCVDELLAMPDAPLRMTKAMTSAIGRAQMGATAWSDADLIGWSLQEAESREAATKYAARRRKT